VSEPPVAVVDDDEDMQRLLALWVRAEGHRARTFANADPFLREDPHTWAAVCLDLHLGGTSGLTVLRETLSRDAELPVVVVTAERDVDTAVEAMRTGAYDYLTKPLTRERFATTLRRAIERRRLTECVRRLSAQVGGKSFGLVGSSAPMRELFRRIERVLDSDITVCILGESGTGKELVARAIHGGGRRRGGPFVAINCAAIPQTLQESELFGHERGAFTGALDRRIGRFEEARGGTLFLDELGEMGAATQASLLRALQDRTIRRVGGRDEIPIDVRVLCATHRDLEAEVEAGRFRRDLYYRLVVYPVHVPPLRARSDDVSALVMHALTRFREDVGRPVECVSPEALEALRRYPWPGNVRELENVVHCAMLSCSGTEITLRDLPPSVVRASAATSCPEVFSDDERVPTLAEVERAAIERALRRTGGNATRAAKLLGIGRSTLYRKLVAYGLDGPPGGGKA